VHIALVDPLIGNVNRQMLGRQRTFLCTFTRDWLSFQCLQLENGRI